MFNPFLVSIHFFQDSAASSSPWCFLNGLTWVATLGSVSDSDWEGYRKNLIHHWKLLLATTNNEKTMKKIYLLRWTSTFRTPKMEVDDSDVFPFPMGEFSGSSREITEENPGNLVEKKVAVAKIIHEDSIQKSTKTQSEVVLPNQPLVKKTLLHR